MNTGLPVTMQDIADCLRINHSTVSRALKGKPGVSAEMRKKIEEQAELMGYRQDPMLAGLVHYRHHKNQPPVIGELAWLNCWPQPEDFRHFKEFVKYWEGASRAAEKYGYRIEEYTRHGPMTLDRIQSILSTRSVQGILIPPHPPLTDLGKFPWEKFALLRFGYSLPALSVDCVACDQLGASMLAYRKIREKGYRRIGFVVRGNAELNTLFRAGYLLAQATDLELSSVTPLVLSPQPNDDRKSDLKLLKTWLRAEKPDAILSPVASLPGMLSELGRRIPEDVGFAVMSIHDGNGNAGIDQNSPEIGRTAVEVLISLINNNHRGLSALPRSHLVPGTWVEGSMLPSRL